jgi:ATP-dependent DNA helicase DinG
VKGLLAEIDRIFHAEDLAAALPGYTVRPLQVRMAMAVGTALERGGLHMFEAGTGIGKSLAYIIPVLLSGRKILISTATLTLQDQLALRDAPAILGALGLHSEVCVLKGRNNYLCLRKWSSSAERLEIPDAFSIWADASVDGDVSGFQGILPPGAWRQFRSDRLDCVGASCRFRGECHFFRARARARKSDLLILNHHLLISGLMTGDILPEADVLVIDEGHRLEDAASECLGVSLGQGAVLAVFDGIAFSDVEADRKALLLERARRLEFSVASLTSGVVETSLWDPVEHREDLETVLAETAGLLSGIEGSEDLLPAAQAAAGIASDCRELMAMGGEDYCCFAETGGRHPILRGVPLDVGPDLRDRVYSSFDTTIITSATLTVAGEFDFFKDRLGASEAITKDFGSPFDYGEQAVMAIPDDLPPQDSHEELAASVWEWGRRLAVALNGRILLLFTSYRNLDLTRRLALEGMPPGIRLLVQGEMSRNSILEEFRRDSRAIILGTSSFWEGVDLPGDMLQAVVIDRLPFASPGHPLMKARMDLIDRSGGSSFARFSLPLAAVRLRQGVGRLIRSHDDFGVVMIMDRRIASSRYRSVFLTSIPPFRRVGTDAVLPFLMEHCSPAGVSLQDGEACAKHDDQP